MISIVKAVRFGNGGQDVTHVERGVIDEHDPREWVVPPQIAEVIEVLNPIKNAQVVRPFVLPLFGINGLILIGGCWWLDCYLKGAKRLKCISHTMSAA